MTVSSVGMIFNFSPSALLIKYKELLISAIKSFFPIILRFDLKVFYNFLAHNNLSLI